MVKLATVKFLQLIALLSVLIAFSMSKPPVHWMDKVVAREFGAFEKQGITQELVETTWNYAKKHKEFKRFQIIDSVVYGDECRIKKTLEVIAKTYKIPDVDFIYYNEDRVKPAFFKRGSLKGCAPIFVSAKHRKLNRAILFSDWMYDVTDDQRGWNFFIRMILDRQDLPWSERICKLFWRGAPWDGNHFGMYDFQNWKTLPRGKLVSESRKYPEIIDALFSEYPQKCVAVDLERCKQEMGEIAFVSWDEVFKFKYQMAIDGVTCSFPATQWKFLSGNLVFKQESPDIMYFYDELIPWKHYVPIRNDLSDLKEKIQWAKTHDDEAQKIAKMGRQFAIDHLMPDQIMLYCYKVLLKYASLQKFKPQHLEIRDEDFASCNIASPSSM